MSTRRELRAFEFGRNLRKIPGINSLTLEQVIEVTHAYVIAASPDGKAQRALTIKVRDGWAE